MFELNKAIARWREEMSTAGIKSSQVLEELEAHLREHIDRQTKSGTSPEQAFGIAKKTFGRADTIKHEFRKITRSSSIFEKLMLGISGVLIGFIVFLSAAAIILCFETREQRLVASMAVASILLVARGWRYAVRFLPVISDSRLRWVAGLGCIAAGFIASSIYCELILPHFEATAHQPRFELALWAVFLIALFFCTGIGLLLSKREREALGMTKS